MTEALRKAAQAALDVLEQASSFTTKRARDESVKAVVDLRAALAAQAEPVAWCDDGALAGCVGSVASAATKEYWARGDRVDRETAARLKHPLYAVR